MTVLRIPRRDPLLGSLFLTQVARDPSGIGRRETLKTSPLSRLSSTIQIHWRPIVLLPNGRIRIASIPSSDGHGRRNLYVPSFTVISTRVSHCSLSQKIVRKIDYRIMIWAWLMFFSLDLDRTNISQANTDNFLEDMNMTTNDFNLGNTLFKVCCIYSRLLSCRIYLDSH